MPIFMLGSEQLDYKKDSTVVQVIKKTGRRFSKVIALRLTRISGFHLKEWIGSSAEGRRRKTRLIQRGEKYGLGMFCLSHLQDPGTKAFLQERTWLLWTCKSGLMKEHS